MRVESAIRLIENLTYRPGWKFEATDYTKRFEDSIMVKYTFPAYHTERELAEQGYPSHTDESWAQFPMQVGNCNSDVELYRRALRHILKIESHEAREFLRVKPTYWAPFHPHRTDGMTAWGEPDEDFRYGVA